MKKYKILSAGFTLAELAIVILIGGLVMMAGALMLNSYIQESRMLLTQSRMQDIDNAIMQYVNVNGVLPCPALLTDTADSTTFGRSTTDASPGGCKKNSAFSSPGNTPGGKVDIGAVPARDLGLSDQEMADAWGDRFVYAVTDSLTDNTTYNSTQGTLSVVDGSGNVIVGTGLSATAPWAQYVIVSYGADRAGAYSIAGAPSGVACPAAGTLENTNCNLSKTSTFRKTMQMSNQTGTNYFDDYVIYHTQVSQSTNAMPSETPSGMVAPFVAGPCPVGWATYAGTGCTTGGLGVCCQKN